jgi:Zn ribbon nucleic-acid-binding protein
MAVKRHYAGINKKSILAKCPFCERLHKVRVFWTGYNLPRIYCKSCRFIVEDINNNISKDLLKPFLV